MKKLLSTLTILLTLTSLFGCSNKKVEEVNKLSQEEVFGGVQTIQVLEGDSFNLQDWFKDSDAFTYTTDEVVDSSKVGGQIIIVKATSKDGQVYTKGQYVDVISIETLYTEGNLTLQTGKKLDDLAIKEGYSITYEGDIDYNKPGDYLIKLHVTDPSGKTYTVERTITIVKEPIQTLKNSNSNKNNTTNTSYTGDDSYIWQLARSYEQNKRGVCDDIARSFLLDYKGLDTMRYEFAETSSPKPGDLIQYSYSNRYGGHVAIYLGNDMALHGGWNYGTDVKIASVYAGDYDVIKFYDTDSIVRDYKKELEDAEAEYYATHTEQEIMDDKYGYITNATYEAFKDACMTEGYSDTLYNTCHRNNWQNIRFPVEHPYVPEPTPTPESDPEPEPTPILDPTPIEEESVPDSTQDNDSILESNVFDE